MRATEYIDIANALLRESYDLHTHSAPSLLPRAQDDFSMLKEADRAGMAGVMIKNHYEPTGARAELANRYAGAIHAKAYGSIVLNETVGGINPYAVESAVRMGAAFVWMPTRDAAYCVKQGPQEGNFFKTKGLSVLDSSGMLTRNALEVLDAARQLGVAVGTGHLSTGESIRLCTTGSKMGVTMVLTHPEWHRTRVGVQTQVELCRRGVFIEKNWMNIAEADCTADRMAYIISQLDPERVLLTSDRGQAGFETPVHGMRLFLQTMLEKGISVPDLSTMIRAVPRQILGGRV